MGHSPSSTFDGSIKNTVAAAGACVVCGRFGTQQGWSAAMARSGVARVARVQICCDRVPALALVLVQEDLFLSGQVTLCVVQLAETSGVVRYARKSRRRGHFWCALSDFARGALQDHG